MQKMSEREAIEALKRLFGECELDLPGQDSLEVLHIAIAALEEIQQYRSIGTVDECRESNDFLEFLYNHIQPNEMEQYLSMYRTKDKTKVNGYADKIGLMPAT